MAKPVPVDHFSRSPVLSRNCNPHKEESQVARCNQVPCSSLSWTENVSLAARDRNIEAEQKLRDFQRKPAQEAGYFFNLEEVLNL